MPDNNFETKTIVTYATILLGGGVIGAGGITAATGQNGIAPKIEVVMSETIKVELPPDQVELMNRVVSGQMMIEITNDSILRLESKFDESQREYKDDQKEKRVLDDSLRTALSAMSQEIAISKRQTEQNSGGLDKLEEKFRMMEREMSSKSNLDKE